MKPIYVDNSATSFPKAPGVSDAIKAYIDHVGCNINRGGYAQSYQLGLDVLTTRQLLCDLFNVSDPRFVVFTPGITYAINMLLEGFLQKGDHVLTTSMEHNAVMRPLHHLQRRGVAFETIPCDINGLSNTAEIERWIKPTTKLLIMSHASNVCGTIQPIKDIYAICKKNNIKFIVDTAQTAGIIPIDAHYMDALAFTAHKGLLATQGLGGFIIKSDFAKQISPVITGGTGSASHEWQQPLTIPDKFESGTLNLPAIIGLKTSLTYIKQIGVSNIYDIKMKLTDKFLQAVHGNKNIRVIGNADINNRIAVVSLDFINKDNAEVSAMLDSQYQIMTRCGLHCAPIAHKTLQTYPHCTVRFSFGYTNTEEEIDCILEAISLITR